MSVLRDIAQRLEDAGLGTFEETIFAGPRPDNPDRMLAVQTYAGETPMLLDPNNRAVDERYSFQVVARAGRARQFEAEQLADQAYRALVGRHLVINGRNYDWITANHLPASMGRDDNDRPLVFVNFQTRRRGIL